MIWQDWAFTIGQIAFIIALIPTIRGKDKPPIFTSLVSGSFLMLFAYTQYSLNLFSSAVTSTILGVSWLYIAFQKYQLGKK